MDDYKDDDDLAKAARRATQREQALAEGWHFVNEAREAIEVCGDVARTLCNWRAMHPDIAKEIPLQEIEKLAREGIV